jgi:hypothetical protein
MRKADKPGTPEFEFSADLLDISETKYKANLPKDSLDWQDSLYAEYTAAGRPKTQRKWITDRIKNAFKSMSKPPAWVDFETSEWPFHKGQPMVFVAQIELKATEATKDLIDGGAVSYFFGLADTGEHGELIMAYKTQTLTRW